MRSSIRAAAHDGAIVTRRNLIRMARLPDVIVFAVVQPIIFVLLFRYVFGGAIDTPGVPYAEFLMSGVFVQTVAFASANTCIALADDVQTGIIERFRTLPMSPAAVLIGRSTADLFVNVLVTPVLLACGLLVGWRIRSSPLEALAGVGLMLLLGYAMIWVSSFVGLSVRSVQVAQSAGVIWLIPVSFLSNAFVPTANMPTVVRTIADWNPVSTVGTAMRELFGNTGDAATAPTSWPDRHALEVSLVWCVVLLAVFVPLSVRRFRRATSR
jgi:ABC-2 type transport system permease protein